MAAVVELLLYATALQMAVCHFCPHLPPKHKLILTVPTLRNGILSAKLGAFRILGHSLITLRLGSGGSHIYFLFADLVPVLLLPSLVLRRLMPGGGKAPFLATPDAEIFFFGLVLPCAILVQRSNSQQNVGMWIMPVCIVNTDIGAHSVRHKAALHILCQQGDIVLLAQFYGERLTPRLTIFVSKW